MADEGIQVYRYEAVSPSGVRIKGRRARMAAFSADAVRQELLDQGFIPIDIRPTARRGLKADLGQLLHRSPKMRVAQLAAFTRELHELLKAGIALPQAFVTLSEDAPTDQLSDVCRDVSGKLRNGVRLGEALSEYPRAFDEIYRAYITSGEKTGSLVQATERLAVMLERQSKMRMKVVSVTTYPMLISGVILLLVIGIIMFLVPQYAEVYASFGAQLPAPTVALINLSKKMPVVLAIAVAVVTGLRLLIMRKVNSSAKAGEWFDRIKFRLPILGKLAHKLALFRWSSTFSGALESGLSQSEALTLAADASGSRWLQAIAPQFVERVMTGHSISELIRDYPRLFPPAMRMMVSTGEDVGEMARMLENAANTIDGEVDMLVATMGAKLEVMLLLFMGVTVGGLLIILYLPILNLTSTIAGGMLDSAS